MVSRPTGNFRGSTHHYIDSSCLPVCHLKRSRRHKVFDAVAQYGKTSVGWFFWLKIHLVANYTAELIAFKITQGNRHDNTASHPTFAKIEIYLLQYPQGPYTNLINDPRMR